LSAKTGNLRAASKVSDGVCWRTAGLFEVQPDKGFASNRTLYLTYTALPEGAKPGGAAAARPAF